MRDFERLSGQICDLLIRSFFFFFINHLKWQKILELFEATDSIELFDFFSLQVAHQVNPFSLSHFVLSNES